MRALLLAILLALGLSSSAGAALLLFPGGAHIVGPPPSFLGMCDVTAVPCAEAWSLQRSSTNAYSGPLLQITNTTNSATQNIVQTPAQVADMSTWSAFCGGTNTPSGGLSTNSHCVISKIYAQVQGSANDLIPSVFNGPFGPNCTAGGNTCACPFTIEIATGYPILNAAAPCEYTLSGDGNAVGVTAGTSSLSILYDGIALSSTYCCGPVGIGHAYNVTDTFGTTFYLSVAEGQFSDPSGNQCQTSTSFCSGLDEESIGDLVDYSPTNVGSVFAAGAFDSGVNQVSSYINGGQLRSPIEPAAALCSTCSGINLPGSVHAGGGGDLSQPAPAVMRAFAFINGVASQSDATAAYANLKSFYSGTVSYTDFTAPTTAIATVQNVSGQNGSGAVTTKTINFGAATTTGKHGVLVGLFWCGSGPCSSNTADVFSAGSVTAGGNACAEVAHTFATSAPGFQTEIWECANLTSAGTAIVATTDGTSVPFLGMLAVEISCPTSGCVADQGGGQGVLGTGWYCNGTTNGNTAVSGEMIYSLAATATTGIFTRQTGINTVSATFKDQYGATGPSGSKYSTSWLQNIVNGDSLCSSATVEP